VSKLTIRVALPAEASHIEGAGEGEPPSSPAPPSVSQVPVVLAKHMPIAQQLAPGAEPQAVSQSLSVAHAVLAQAEPPLSSPLPLLEPEFWFWSPLPLLPELLPLLLLFTEASAPPFLGVKPEVVLFEPPQAAIKPTAPRPIVRLRIEPIFIWRLPSAAPMSGAPHLLS
jgi:hypothetical protein